jgi:hypothetical protein
MNIKKAFEKHNILTDQMINEVLENPEDIVVSKVIMLLVEAYHTNWVLL